MAQQLPVGAVHLISRDPPLSVIARMAEEPPIIESGFGGWEEITRPRRRPITTFRGPPAFHMTLPLVLDGWAKQRSVQSNITAIQRMGRPTASNGEPPRIRVAAPGTSVQYQNLQWIIDSITWGAALTNRRGVRMRQEVTLALIQYVEDVYLQEKSAANRRRTQAQPAQQGAAQKRVVAKATPPRASAVARGETVVRGESLSAIAARELGDAARWPEIAKLNNLRDPDFITPGQVLRLP